MLTELFIEGNAVDVSENLSTLITYAIDDIKDFGAKNTSFSKTIILPGTARNNKTFGNIFDVNASNPYDPSLPNVLTNFNAAKSAQAYIFQGNIQVFKGILRILAINVDRGVKEYEVAVFGELGGLVAAMGNKRLENLDFSAYNQTYSLANIVNSWDNAPGTGVYYPLIDYGTASIGTYGVIKHDWQFNTFRPALFVKEYIDKIFTSSNYTYDCALFNTARFKNLIVPYNKKILEMLVTQVFSASRSSGAHVIDQATVFTVPLQMSTVIGSSFTPSNSNSRFTYNPATPLSATFNFSGNGSFIGNNTGYTIVVKRNGVDIPGTTMTFAQTNDSFTHFFVYSSSITLSLNQNDYIEVVIGTTSNPTGTDNIIVQNFGLGANSVTPVFAAVSLGDFIQINSTIPRGILQKDFFSSILKLFNLYVYEDKNVSYKLNITPYVDFYDIDPAHAIDWTYKLNRDKVIKLKPLSEINSRYYEFKYKQDNDFYNEEYRKRYNENYGDRIYDSEFEFANEVSTTQIAFSGTPIVGYTAEDKVYSTIFKKSGAVEECIDSNIRILQIKKVTGVTSWNILNAGTILGSYNVYGYAGHLDDPDAPSNDIGFGVPKELYFSLVSGDLSVNQFNIYYSSYMSEITDKDSKLLTASFRLNAKDIYNLDFSKLIYLDGSLFRLNQITDYNASSEDECGAELLKVIETIYADLG